MASPTRTSTETADAVSRAGTPTPLRPLWKRRWFMAVAAIVALSAITATIYAITSNGSAPPEPPSHTPGPPETLTRQEMLEAISELVEAGEAFDAGEYTVKQIPAGEYATVNLDPPPVLGPHFYEVSNPARLPLRAEDTFSYVTVQGTGDITTPVVLIKVEALPRLGVTGARQIWEILHDTQDYFAAGLYRVGTDLPAGTYTISLSPDDFMVHLRSVHVSTCALFAQPWGHRDNTASVPKLFDGINAPEPDWTITVADGQFLYVSPGSEIQPNR